MAVEVAETFGNNVFLFSERFQLFGDAAISNQPFDEFGDAELFADIDEWFTEGGNIAELGVEATNRFVVVSLRTAAFVDLLPHARKGDRVSTRESGAFAAPVDTRPVAGKFALVEGLAGFV